MEKGGTNAQPSGCTLALFHAAVGAGGNAPPGGYVSNDGHHFACKNPGRLLAAFHVLVVRSRICISLTYIVPQDLRNRHVCPPQVTGYFANNMI